MTHRERQREKQAPRRDHDLSQRQMLNPRATQGPPGSKDFLDLGVFLCSDGVDFLG